MQILFLIIFSLTVLAFEINSGQIIFHGEAKPGCLLIGFAKDAERVTLDDRSIQVDSGIFVFGFDRDAKGTHYLKVRFKNGKVELKKFDLPKREYDIQKIDKMEQKYVTPPKKELKRIAEERELMKNAREEIGRIDSAFFASGFTFPVTGGKITGIFGSQRILNGTPKSPHNGLDIAAPTGTPVYAMADGIVRLTGDDFYYNGNFVLLDHGQGLNSIYLHMKKTSVKDGQWVRKGEKIGEIGTTGRSTGPHLHWGVQWYSKRIDPESLLQLTFE